MNIPEEVIEKAARAIVRSLDGDDDHDVYGIYTAFYGDETTGTVDGQVNALLLARAALSAAAPSLMAMAWEEGKDAVWLDENESRYFLSYDPNPYRKEQS